MGTTIRQIASLNGFEYTILIRLLLSAACGGVIGLEKELRGRPAGLKTFSLVCLGSALAMITNEYICRYLNNSTGDVTRMAAQVISGIGFLGAGTIIITRDNSKIRGLTTAAALWVTASIGITIGAGFYVAGIFCVLLVVLTSKVYEYLDMKIVAHISLMRIFMEGSDDKILLRTLDYFNEKGYEVKELKRTSEDKWYAEDTAAIIEIQLTRTRHDQIITDLKKIPGVVIAMELK